MPASAEPGPRGGRLRVLRSDGTWDALASGELELQVWSSAPGDERDDSRPAHGTVSVPVVEGRFALPTSLSEGGTARFAQPVAFFDGADPDGAGASDSAAIPFDGLTLWSTDGSLAAEELDLRAAEAQPLRISAVDGLSGLPLSRLKVEVFPTVEVLSTPPGEWDAPAIQRTSGATPFILDPLPLLGGRTADCSLRVGAEGYAPAGVVVDRREPADLQLVLWPEATLEVRTRGRVDDTTWLEVACLDDGGPGTRHSLNGSVRKLTGLGPGLYGITWIEMSSTGVQRRLDRASVRLSSGEQRELWLEAPVRRSVETVPEVAELWLPESWFEFDGAEAVDIEEHLLVLRSARRGGAFDLHSGRGHANSGEPAPLHGAAGRGLASLGAVEHDGAPGRLFEFSAAGLPAGRYAATLIPEGVALWIELPAFDGETPRFVAPEPVEWQLDTHAVAEIQGHEPPGPLKWAVELPGFDGPRIPREVLPDGEGRYAFRAPRGMLSLELEGTGWAIDPRQQRTDDPKQTLELWPLVQFGLFLQRDELPFPWSGDYELELHSDSGDTAVYAFEGRSLLSRLGVGTSGAFRVVVRSAGGASWTSTPLYFGSVGHEKIVKLTPQ